VKDFCGIRRLTTAIVTLLWLALASGCGYHASGKAVRLPTSLHTLYVPAFDNSTQNYRVAEFLTTAVIQELHSRTNYRVLTTNDGSADATLQGTVTSATTGALTYDSVNGRISSALVLITMKVSLVNRQGQTLWDNPNLLFREVYQVSTDPGSFFSEETPAVQRIARDFSRSLVSGMLEAY
jgi:hypothetical protein